MQKKISLLVSDDTGCVFSCPLPDTRQETARAVLREAGFSPVFYAAEIFDGCSPASPVDPFLYVAWTERDNITGASNDPREAVYLDHDAGRDFASLTGGIAFPTWGDAAYVVNVWFAGKARADVSEKFRCREAAEKFAESYDAPEYRDAEAKVSIIPPPAKCPRCGGPLAAFSPSGQGRAACDACGLWWD